MSQHYLHVEIAAKSLDAAVEQALAQLMCTRAEVDVEIGADVAIGAAATGAAGFT